ncbi:MAG: hypothetical protein J0H39_03825 [Alphaproteobacteria bacterium]|nr:hypothetical protein [Alphaproteobacteria bacterium]
MASKFVHQTTETMTDWASTVCEVAVWFWEWLGSALNSNFSTSAIGSLAGAAGGAYAIQRIGDKAKAREEIEKQIGHSNSATLLASDALNVFFALKSQHTIPLLKRYRAVLTAHAAFIEGISKGTIAKNTVFEPQLDLHQLEEIYEGMVDPLVSVISKDLKAPGQLVLMAGALRRCVEQLRTAILKRNKLIDEWSKEIVQPNFSKVQLYLGIKNAGGHQSTVYPSYMTTIEKSLDDCIWFTKTLSDLLQAYGRQMQSKYGRKKPAWLKLGRERPKVTGVNLVDGHEALVPSSVGFEDWVRSIEGLFNEKK